MSSLKWQWAVVVLVAVLTRGGVLLVLAPSLREDPDAYRRLSETLATHGVFGTVDADGQAVATAFRPPAYPWLLSWWVEEGRLSIIDVAWLHALLGLATICLTFWLARRLFAEAVIGGPGEAGATREVPVRQAADAADKRPLVAALLVAIDPILLVQSTQVMTETLATFLTVSAWTCWVWLVARTTSVAKMLLSAVALAGLLAVAFLCRPPFLIWAGLLTVALGWWAWQCRQWRLFAAAGLIVVVLAAAIGLWTERNRRALGHPVWATSHGGYTVLLGNNPLFYEYLRSHQFGHAWQAEPFHRAWSFRDLEDPLAEGFWQEDYAERKGSPVVEDEVADDALAYAAAKQTIRQQPMMFVWASVVRVGRLWSPIPMVTDDRAGWKIWGVGMFYLVVAVLVIRGVWTLGRRLLSPPWLAGLLLAVALTAVHAVYWSNMRMRAPAVPWISLLAAAGATHLCSGSRDTSG